ncbi:MAG: RHS repeat-associated core domain-containing protein, partial [Gammaproteobacteria bacterium]|nr:RHS repeat-associated core domain-containing protein [Gammaproteobacteria bacterium]
KAYGETYYTYRKNNDSSFPQQTGYRYTGQRQEPDIGLYDYRARWYDPSLGRFLQADTIVPNPGGPQNLNRYSYVGNSPIRYNDPDGHCAPFCTALAGAVAGGIIGAASAALPKMVENVRRGQPLTTDIDPTEVGRAALTGAVVGGIAGGTFGAGTAVLGTGWGATAIAGAASGWIGGRTSDLSNATWNEYDRWRQGQSPSLQRTMDDAIANGLLDKQQWLFDATTGAVSVGLGKAGITLLGKTQFVSVGQIANAGPPTIRFFPNGEAYLDYGRTIQLPQDGMDRLLASIAAGNTLLVEELLAQLSDRAVDEVIDNGN